jgi:RNA polymerase sigma factor (sigma-70 family)
MVLGVCRRVLGNAHDAEDAFQATFLLLARKAATVRQRGAVGSWLYGVARRAGLQAKRAAQRRRAREANAMPRQGADEESWGAVREALDEELARLPDCYRAALVLCDLEGRTRKEAGRVLGWPEGTVASRLARARRLLAKRLVKYGLPLSGGAVAAALADGASAAVPAPLLCSTVQAAVLIAAGPTAVSSPAIALMKEVSKAMLLTKLKITVAGLMVVGLLGVSGLVYRAAGQTSPTEGREVGKPRTEIESLRREVELLRFNLEVVLEKCRAQEDELRKLRGQATVRKSADEKAALEQAELARALRGRLEKERYAAQFALADAQLQKEALEKEHKARLEKERFAAEKALAELKHQMAAKAGAPDPLQEIEAALKAIRGAPNNEARERAEKALEQAVKKLRQQH